MPNDAKLGLIAGIGLTIVLAVIYCRKDEALAEPGSAAFVQPAPASTPVPLPLPTQRALILRSTSHGGVEMPARTASDRPAERDAEPDAATEPIPEAETDEPGYRRPERFQP